MTCESIVEENITDFEDGVIEEDEECEEDGLADEKTDYSQYLVDNTIAYPVSKIWRTLHLIAFRLWEKHIG